MTRRTPSVADEIERYLRTGDTEPYHAAWSGQSFLESAQLASADLENALVAEVSRRANGWQPPPARRNGWKAILECCAPPRLPRRAAPSTKTESDR